MNGGEEWWGDGFEENRRRKEDHERAMSKYVIDAGWAVEALVARFAERRREILEAADWVYVQQPEMEATDGALFNKVSLEIRSFYEQATLSNAERIKAKLHVKAFEHAALDALQISVAAHVYGYKHLTAVLDDTHTVTFETPASWWQHFKRDVLKLTCRQASETRVVTASFSREQMSMFPELPFDAPNSWGPRIDLAIPTRLTWKETWQVQA